jgi:hypothetical protein
MQKAKIGQLIAGNYIKPKYPDDIIGTEYAAMLKKHLSHRCQVSTSWFWGDSVIFSRFDGS